MVECHLVQCIIGENMTNETILGQGEFNADTEVIIIKWLLNISILECSFRALDNRLFTMRSKKDKWGVSLLVKDLRYLNTIHLAIKIYIQNDKVRFFLLDECQGINPVCCTTTDRVPQLFQAPFLYTGDN